ncbi:sporulation protein rmd1 [Pichia californica]|nr:sporulation protein rmd1 [[Candida] californica]
MSGGEPNESTLLLNENPYQKAVEQELSQVKSKNSNSNNSNNVISTATTPSIGNKKVISKALGPNMTPQRTSRVTQKLKLLPESLDYETVDDDDDDDDDDNLNNETNLEIKGTNNNNKVNNNNSTAITPNNKSISNTKATALKQYSLQKIKDRNARKDAARLGKKHRSMLPRVTAYCTAGSYKMRDFIRWLKDKRRIHSTAPKLFDECIYTPFTYKDWRRNSSSKSIRLDDEGGIIDVGKRYTDIFIFEYGVVVLWGFTKREERLFLYDLAKFENEKLADEDVQKEEFNYYITQSYQPRIYNDFFTLRDDSNHMLKLSISYAISQSVKISLFEELVDNTIEDTQDIPQQISQTGKVEMSREEIMKSIGELFILRININLHGSILDSPELMWSEPELEPIYQATRGYLEINQRVALLNQRLEIISDLLQMLKEQLGHNNDEQLELTVILLIGAEVLVSLINIVVDLYSQRK